MTGMQKVERLRRDVNVALNSTDVVPRAFSRNQVRTGKDVPWILRKELE